MPRHVATIGLTNPASVRRNCSKPATPARKIAVNATSRVDAVVNPVHHAINSVISCAGRANRHACRDQSDRNNNRWKAVQPRLKHANMHHVRMAKVAAVAAVAAEAAIVSKGVTSRP